MNENDKSGVSVYAAIELSKSTWLVAVLSPNSDRVKLRQVRGGDTAALVGMLKREQASAAQVDGRGKVTCNPPPSPLIFVQTFRMRRECSGAQARLQSLLRKHLIRVFRLPGQYDTANAT